MESQKKKLYMKMGMVVLGALCIAVGMFLQSNQQVTNEQGQVLLPRKEVGGSGYNETLFVEMGAEEQELEINISSHAYSEEELEIVFAEAIVALEEEMLGENESLDHIRFDMNFVHQLSDSKITIVWSVDNNQVINDKGELQEENISDEGELVQISAMLSFGENSRIQEYFARVYPPIVSQADQNLSALREEIATRDQETRQEKFLALPNQLNGQAISWHFPRSFDFVWIIFFGIAMAFLLFMAEKQKQKGAHKERMLQISYDYSQVVGTFTLFLGAGMTPRNAWSKMVQMYFGQKQEKGERYVYEEMAVTMYEIQGGKLEVECYESFGNRCGTIAYKKFASILAQNLKKGTKGMTQLLKNEVGIAFEERMNLAKRLGEEAGTKLLVPMFMMLSIVFAIVIVPAFLSMNI
ncbi:MAG: secretion protein F [Lachnospiraceae bacterium]|nr:secretion protein F [Lachnospiraceae bacterium]